MSRIEALELQENPFERPAGFHLAEFWQASLRRMDALQYPLMAEVRLSELGVKIMEFVCASYVIAHAVIEPADDDGWHRAQLPAGKPPHGCSDLLRFGAEIEVIGPPELRLAMEALVFKLAERYR